MPRAHSVILPRDRTPLFPDQCPFSGQRHPGAQVRIISRDGFARDKFLRGWFSTKVPCVPSHRWRVHLQRLWIFVRTAIVGLGSMAFAAVFLFSGMKGAAQGLWSLGFAVVCICLLVWWEQTHPPAFTIYVRGDAVHYDFRDQQYAQAFAALNGAASDG